MAAGSFEVDCTEWEEYDGEESGDDRVTIFLAIKYQKNQKVSERSSSGHSTSKTSQSSAARPNSAKSNTGPNFDNNSNNMLHDHVA